MIALLRHTMTVSRNQQNTKKLWSHSLDFIKILEITRPALSSATSSSRLIHQMNRLLSCMPTLCSWKTKLRVQLMCMFSFWTRSLTISTPYLSLSNCSEEQAELLISHNTSRKLRKPVSDRTWLVYPSAKVCTTDIQEMLYKLWKTSILQDLTTSMVSQQESIW